jgi:OOP family OmpA-OmpF porin
MKKYIIAALLLFAFKAQAQYILKEADQQFNLYNYSKAVKLYAAAYQKKQTAYSASRLAESYLKDFNYTEAEKWYTTSVSMPDAISENRLQYAKILQNNGKYEEAKEQFKQYMSTSNTTDAKLLQNWIASCDSAKLWMQHPADVKISSESGLNSAASDWAPVSYQNGIVFTSDRYFTASHMVGKKHRPFLKFDGRMILPSDQIYLWTGRNYNHLYFKDENDSLTLFPLDPGTNYHVGTSSFTAAGDMVFFTLTRIPSTIKKYEKIRTINIEIYSSQKDGAGKWSKPVPVPFNKVSEYSVGDPFITKKGDTLYFSSNMPGGLGGTDLYRAIKSSSGDWGVPQNLTELNTAGNERSPVFDHSGNFYFASDGRVGMGGLDIFRCNNFGNGKSHIENLKYPVNSSKDDFAFSAGNDVQYFSSNRDGGLGADDIYSMKIAQKKPEVVITPVIVADPDPKIPVEGIGEDEIVLKPIYYNFDKYNIRPEAAKELDRLVAIMDENPNIDIILGSHTDSRGVDVYNLWLSQKRAESAAAYLASHGIAKSRLTAKGYGETRLVNRCANGVSCSLKEHQANRRTEFKIRKKD